MNTINVLQMQADRGVCGTYRMQFPIILMTTNGSKHNFTSSTLPITDANFLKHINVIRVQRLLTENNLRYVKHILKPASQRYGIQLVYDIDDVMGEHIPEWNRARSVYVKEGVTETTIEIMQLMDVVTVTTDKLKEFYVEQFGIESDRIVVIPNTIPNWWGNFYDIARQETIWRETKERPRILLPLSNSHYGEDGALDDLTHLEDFIRSTTDKYEWVFMGKIPKRFEKELNDGVITYAGSVDIMNYPHAVHNVRASVIVAPLVDNVFNSCKSNIKQLEGWSQGIPVIAQDMMCYNKYSDDVFTTPEDLESKIDTLMRSRKRYLDKVESNFTLMTEGFEGFPNGGWMERNIRQWDQLFGMPRRTVELRLTGE